MMGLGYLGNGGGPSSSNLSPLAPPFTVDRSNPKANPNSNTNPLATFTEPTPYGVPFSSSLHNWHYSQPSVSRPDFVSDFESEVNSVRTTSLPLGNDYCYLGSESINPPSTQWAPPNPSVSNTTNPFSYLGGANQYYPPYGSQVVDDNSSLVGVNEVGYDLLSTAGIVPMVGSSQVDYTQGLSTVEFPPPWGSFWNGLGEAKRGKRAEADGSSHLEEVDLSGSLAYKDNKKQGGIDVGCLKKCEDNLASSHRKYDEVLGRENFSQLDDKYLVQDLGFNHIESTKAPILGSGTKYTESILKLPPLETATFSSNHQKSYIAYEKRFQLFDSCTNDYVSATSSSPTLIIRPPSFGTKPSVSAPVSSKIMDTGNIAAVNTKDVGTQSLLVEKEPQLLQNSEGKEGCLDANHLSFHIGRNDHRTVGSSSAKEEMSNKLLSRNAFGHAIKPRFGAQVPDNNVPQSFSLAVGSNEAFKHTASSLESLDHHNAGEDSPCWKGAPASHSSPFENLEAMSSQKLMKKLEACDSINSQGSQVSPPCTDTMKTFSQDNEPLQTDGFCTDNCSSLTVKRDLNFNMPAKEHKTSAAAAANTDSAESNRISGVQFLVDEDNIMKQYDLLNGSKSESGSINLNKKQLSPSTDKFSSNRKFDLQACSVDYEICSSGTSEDGCVPLHAVENVLCSPSSGEDTVKTHGMESSPKLDVQVLVNAMHNISQLLLVHCSNDASALNQQDLKVLEQAMRNINMCKSKKIVLQSPTQNAMFPKEGISRTVEEGASGVKAQSVNKVGNTSFGLLDSCSKLEQKTNIDVLSKEFLENLNFVSSRGISDVSRHRNMVQDIRKVLEENFQLEEEIPSETLLYKNLWLDAEAELCSFGFKARFDRAKIQMENCGSEKAKENLVAMEKLPTSHMFPDLSTIHESIPRANDSASPKKSVQYSCISSPRSHVDDAEASVMARFLILKSREDNTESCNVEEKQLPDFDDVGFSGKRNQNGNKSFDVTVGSWLQHRGGQSKEDKGVSFVDDPQLESVKEVHLSGTDDPTVQPYINSRLRNQIASIGVSASGWYDNSSSDWEHVLKDDFAWQK